MYRTVFSFFLCAALIAAHLFQAAAAGLSHTAPTVTVLPLPVPEITNIDAATGVVTVSLSGFDPEIETDLNVAVALHDENENRIELTREISVTDPDEIKLTLAETIRVGHTVVPLIRNRDAEASGDGVQISARDIQSLKVPVELWEDNRVVIDAVQHATGKQDIADVFYNDLLKITFIDMSSNAMDSIPEIFGELKNLEYLDLRGNAFTEIPDCVYLLTGLKYLDVSNNNLTVIQEDVRNLTRLDTLDVSLNYLVDYDLPMIVPIYRDTGNFTFGSRTGQYSFQLLPPDADREYIGNTAQFEVLWSFGGEKITGTVEDHRKELFVSMYPAYRSYRPLIYSYTAQNGEIQAFTADYVLVSLPEAGAVVQPVLEVGERE